MKLPMAVSSATWDLLERLRPDLDLVIDVFDASLTAVLPVSPDPSASALRSLVADGGSADAREHLEAAVRAGRHSLISADGLRIGFYPLRFHRDVVGVLAAAGVDRERATDDESPPARELDRRLDRLGWSLRGSLEADMVVWERIDRADHRARWAESLLPFIDFLQACDDESAVFTAIVQAAGVWGDLDAQVFTRTLQPRYTLEAQLPMRGRDDAPATFDAAFVDACPFGRQAPIRISSIAELEQLGWRSGVSEVTLYPVALGDHPAAWVLAIMGAVDERFDQVFRTLTRTMGARLEAFVSRRVRVLRENLAARMQARDAPVASVAAQMLGDFVSALPISHARLLASPGDDVTRHTLAAVGGTLFGALPTHLPPQESLLQPDRLILPLQVGLSSPAVLDLGASLGASFGIGDTAVAEAGATVLEMWLAGAVRGLSTGSTGLFGSRVTGEFERRISEELDRAHRFNLRTGLIVIDARDKASRRRALGEAPMVEAVRGQLRASDILGQLDDGRLAALLVHTDVQGLDAVAVRMERRLAALSTEAQVPLAVLGTAAFPSAGETAQHLLRAAEADLARRGDALSGRPSRLEATGTTA